MPACCGGGGLPNDKYSTFADACYHGNVEKMKMVLKKEKQKDRVINKIDPNDGMSPLHRAAQKGSVDAIKFLLENNADARKATESSEETPLHIATFHRNDNAVAELLKSPAVQDVNTPEKQHGMTPLHIAIYRGCPKIAEMLLEAGANPTLPDKNGQDAMKMAEFWNEQENSGLSSPSAKHRQTFTMLKDKLQH